MPLVWRRLALSLLLASGACHRGASSAPTTDNALQAVDDGTVTRVAEPPVLVAIEPGENVEAIVRDCLGAGEESCNAIDDDCDGVIDQGCGYGAGLMQITVAWNTGSDLDLYVRVPSGETLSFQRRTSAEGGRIDHSGRGDCDPSIPNPRVENLRWMRGRPEPGNYEVQVHYWGECVSRGGPTTATLSIALDREIVGEFRYTLLPGERKQLLRFVIE